MAVRETLDLCRSMALEVAAIARLIELAEQRIPLNPDGCRGISLNDMPRGGNDSTAAACARVDGFEQWYARDHAELVMLAERVEVLIAGLETWSKVLIRAYYIDGKTDTEVASMMGYNFRQTAQNKRAEIVDRLCIGA